jgi:glc operon protein GlcG
MKILLVIVTLLSAVAVVTAAGPGVTFIGADKVSESLAKGSVLVTQPDLIVQGAHRAEAGQVEVHDKETDVIYLIEGEATIVTGGTMVGGKNTTPGQWRGTEIQGGETRHLTKGDVIVIPAGIPHWFKEVPKSVNYFVVKAVKP